MPTDLFASLRKAMPRIDETPVRQGTILTEPGISPGTPAAVDQTNQSQLINRPPSWMSRAFQLAAAWLPSQLAMGKRVQVVTELYQPRILVYDFPQPGAGLGLTIPIPAGRIWEIIAWQMRLVTSAVAGNRAVFVSAGFQGSTLGGFRAGGNFTQVAATTVDYYWGPIGAFGPTLTQPIALDATNLVMIPAPAGMRLRGKETGADAHVADQVTWGLAGAFDVGDQFQLCRVMVKEWT